MKSGRKWTNLEDLDFEPRQLIPMRDDKWAVGDEVAWIPQAFAAFLEAHAPVRPPTPMDSNPPPPT